jgi:glycosyltransferase involved in cell wall biosynthesis
MKPKVSVIVPIYNVEKYIERCARSLFEQTLDDIEYIFVDDCSPDNSISILKRVIEDYQDRIDNIHILSNKSNSGTVQARLKGINFASGDYVIHCDPDDWIDSDYIEGLYSIAVDNQADIVWTDFTREYQDKSERICQYNSTDKLEMLQRFLQDWTFMGSLWNRLVSTNIVKSNEIVNPQSSIIEDLVWVFQYTLLANKMVYTDKYSYHYRVNPQSLTAQYTDIQKALNKYTTSVPNIRVLEGVINQSIFTDELSDYLMLRKFMQKVRLLPAITQLHDDSIYLNTFKEINHRIYFSKLISAKDKLRHLLIMTKLYQLITRIKQ